MLPKVSPRKTRPGSRNLATRVTQTLAHPLDCVVINWLALGRGFLNSIGGLVTLKGVFPMRAVGIAPPSPQPEVPPCPSWPAVASEPERMHLSRPFQAPVATAGSQTHFHWSSVGRRGRSRV